MTQIKEEVKMMAGIEKKQRSLMNMILRIRKKEHLKSRKLLMKEAG
ncbi:hypothetical protein ABID31_000033 [Chryseobacterium flavum]|nr:hypothetical protein [Chryseobacterium flavum]